MNAEQSKSTLSENMGNGPVAVLVVKSGGTPTSDLHERFNDTSRIDHVDNLEDALLALREKSFDWVVLDPQILLQAPTVQTDRQAATILETVTQGICIVGSDGHLVWANPKMLSFPDKVREEISRYCVETFSWAVSEVTRKPSHLRGRRFTITTEDNSYYEVTATPVIDLDHRITRVAAVAWDATNVKRMQEKLDAIDHAGFELVRLDSEQINRLDAQERLALLEQKIIRFTREVMRFDNFAIRLLDKTTNKLELILSAGMPTEAQELELFASADGNGIGGFVAQCGRSYICPDVTKDARYLMGISNARSSLTVPLRLHDQVIGIFNVESERPAAFGEDDKQFAEIFARHVALALHILDLLISERSRTTGKLGSDVMAEIRGPLNDIMTDIASLKEDYIGLDDLRKRLDKISDYTVSIRDSIKQVTSTRPGLIGRRPGGMKRQDPVLGGKRVLVADDEDMIRDTVRDVLISYGCQVQTVQNGQAAIDLLKSQPFDLVLSDIRMPDKNGYEVFAAAKDINIATPVILMTGFGYDPNHSIVRARREGLAAVLFKPFKVDQLLGELRTALRKPAGI